MTTLTVDMESVQDMMSALDQIAARIEELGTSAAELSLDPDDVVYRQDLPCGSTQAFADDLWELTRETGIARIIRSLAQFAQSGYPFAFSDLIARFGMTAEFLSYGMRELGNVEEALGAQLLNCNWISDDGLGGPGCVCFTMHPDVRDRLLLLASQSEESESC